MASYLLLQGGEGPVSVWRSSQHSSETFLRCSLRLIEEAEDRGHKFLATTGRPRNVEVQRSSCLLGMPQYVVTMPF